MRITKSVLVFISLAKLLFCAEAILIDFNNLSDTTIDFTKFALLRGFPEEATKTMKVDLSIPNWRVIVNPSSWTNESMKKTKIVEVKKSNVFPGVNLLGVRIYFPERHANAYAIIKPPFTIPSFFESEKNPDGSGSMFLNKGVVRNVGILRKVSVTFLGNNLNYGLSVRIENNKGEIKDIFIGYMNFIGWRTITWVNPMLDEELKYRDLNKNYIPYYPGEYPYIKFIGFVIHKNDPDVSGNFVTMFKEVKIEYDEAFLEIGNAEINQDDIFGIHKEELIEKAKIETSKVTKRIFYEWLENQKMDKTLQNGK